MTLLEMSLAGSVMIAVVFLVRNLLLHRLPKKTFVLLWGIVVIRLLVPVQIASSLSIYSMLPEVWLETVQGSGESGKGSYTEGSPEDENAGTAAVGMAHADMVHMEKDNVGTDYTGTDYVGADRSVTGSSGQKPFAPGGTDAAGRALALPGWAGLIAPAGSLLCAGWFLAVYFISRRKFAESLPVRNAYVEDFLKAHRLRRKVCVRRLGGIGTPLTYGVWRPVILFPDKTDWTNQTELEFMLTHEYVHIRHFDVLFKWVVTAALCVHWFNPLVWLLYVQCNRDIELSCDETVVHMSGRQSRNSYALTLIAMAERKSISVPLCNGFSANTLEERIEAIMLMNGFSVKVAAAALLLVAAVTVLFATSGERVASSGEMHSPVGTDAPVWDASGSDPGAENERDEAARGDNAQNPDETGEADRTDEQKYTIKYFQEGMPQEEAAWSVKGNGYQILFPVDEEVVSSAPVGFTYRHNENIFLRVLVYEGMSAEQAGELLADEGYAETENGDYRIQTWKGDTPCAEIIRLVEDVYSTYGVSYGFPDTSEYEEGIGTYLRAVAHTFSLDTAGLSDDGEALKEAAKGFGDAYLTGDVQACLGYMGSEADTSCLQELEQGRFDLAGARATRLCMGTVEEAPDGGKAWLQIECSNPRAGEGNVYLGIALRREAGVWRVVSFGWEM